MKTLFINLIAFIFVIPAMAQNNGNKLVSLSGVTVRPVNISYLQAVLDHRFPSFVKNLQQKTARYDVTQAAVFNGKYDGYEVMFSHENGGIIATYDEYGKIMETKERFRNITFPKSVRDRIYLDNPGWTIHKDAYIVSYIQGEEVKRVCRVQLRKDGKKKNLDIDI